LRARRSRTVEASAAVLWDIVSDPRTFSRWWPRVERVEDVARGGFTELLRSDKGAVVRADFRIVERASPRRIRWVQDLEGTPFGGLLRSSETTILLEPRGVATVVTMLLDQRLRGASRFGAAMVRRAGARQLTLALQGLAELVEA
jgi:uncharacterized protein YndB with AHSA1/START domain